jgi:hypothetical protein
VIADFAQLGRATSAGATDGTEPDGQISPPLVHNPAIRRGFQVLPASAANSDFTVGHLNPRTQERVSDG